MKAQAYAVLSGLVGTAMLFVGVTFFAAFFGAHAPDAEPSLPVGPTGMYFVAFSGSALVAWGGCLIGQLRASQASRSVATATVIGLVLSATYRIVVWVVGDYWTWSGLTILKYTIGYGYGHRIFFSLNWVLALVIIGTLLLKFTKQERVAAHYNKPPMIIGFFYSLDLLLPIIQLRQRHYEVDLQGPVRYYFYFHQIMGYILASFLITGLSGLTQ